MGLRIPQPDTGPWKLGEHVCVHGKGFGNITTLTHDVGCRPLAIVEIPRRDHHEESGRTVEWTERVGVMLGRVPAPHEPVRRVKSGTRTPLRVRSWEVSR